MAKKKAKKLPYWFSKLARKAVLEAYKQARKAKTKPSYGQGVPEFLAVIYYANRYLGWNWEKIAKYIKKLSQALVQKDPKKFRKPIELKKSTVYLRLKEAEGEAERIENIIKEWRGKYGEVKPAPEIPIDYDLLLRFEEELKKPKKDIRKLEQLAEKMVKYPDPRVRDAIVSYAKSIIRGERVQEMLKTLKRMILFIQFMKEQMGKPDPKEWTEDDVKLAFDVMTNYVFDTKQMRIVPAEEYFGEPKKVSKDSISNKFAPIVYIFRPEAKNRWNLRGAFKVKGQRRGEAYVLEPDEYMRAKRYVLSLKEIIITTKKQKTKLRLTPEMKEELDILLDLHITTQAREGSKATKRGGRVLTGGILDVRWNDFTPSPQGLKVRIREPKTMKKTADFPAIWEGIVVNAIFDDLSSRIEQLARKRGADFTSDEPVFQHVSYKHYTAIVKALGKYVGKDIRPHDLRRTGAYWKIKYWNAPLETIAGYKGEKKFTSPMGVGWEDPSTLFEYYVDLSFKAEQVLTTIKKHGLHKLMFEDPEKAIEVASKVVV